MEGILNNHLQMRKMAIAAGFVGAAPGIDFQKANADELRKGGVGSGRKPIKDHAQYEHGKTELQYSTAHGDAKYSNESAAKQAYHDQAKQNPKGGTAMVAMNSGHHIVTSHKRASIFEKQGSGKVVANHEVNIKKAHGEGSRGGKVIGHLASGKPIYESGGTHNAHLKFTADEHREAASRLKKIGAC